MAKPAPDVLEGAPLRYAPENEQGVVFLFSQLAKRWSLRVDKVRSGFPDCIAFQKVQGGEKQVRIEFEFKSRNFKQQKHVAKNCDWIVCWEDNWPDPPHGLRIVELRREFGLGRNIWIVPLKPSNSHELPDRTTSEPWSVPRQSHKDDLILFYSTSPDKCIRHIFILKDRAHWQKAVWRKGYDYMAPIKRLCALKSPVYLHEIRDDPVLKTAPFVRGSMQGRPNVIEYWPPLYRMIVSRNPRLRLQLQKYAPENV